MLYPTLLCKACQSGKTNEAFNDRITEQNCKSINKRKLGIFICDNSLLLTRQTNIRATNSDIAIQGDIITMSSKEQINQVKKLYKTIINNINLTTILCCGNGRRLKDISELLELLQKYLEQYEVFIYVDEADKILHSKNAKEQLKLWRENALIRRITLITATPQEDESKGLAVNCGVLTLMPIKTIAAPNYHYLCDSRLIDTTSISASVNVDYIDEVFSKYITSGPQLGDVWFIPGEHKTETHDEIEDLLFTLGFNCVLKINGKQKQLTYIETIVDSSKKINYKVHVKTFENIHKEICHGADDIEFSPYTNELSKWLERYYIRNNGKQKWKFAITGNMCISRGISIQSPNCMITHAIYGPKCARSITGQYQLFARVCGNIKDFPNYKINGPPTVFCNEYIFKKCCRMEQQANKLARYSQIKNGSTTEVDATFISTLTD